MIATSDPGSYNWSLPEMTCHPQRERDRVEGGRGERGEQVMVETSHNENIITNKC